MGNDIETGRSRVEESPHFYWFQLLSKNKKKTFYYSIIEWFNMQVFIKNYMW